MCVIARVRDGAGVPHGQAVMHLLEGTQGVPKPPLPIPAHG